MHSLEGLGGVFGKLEAKALHGDSVVQELLVILKESKDELKLPPFLGEALPNQANTERRTMPNVYCIYCSASQKSITTAA